MEDAEESSLSRDHPGEPNFPNQPVSILHRSSLDQSLFRKEADRTVSFKTEVLVREPMFVDYIVRLLDKNRGKIAVFDIEKVTSTLVVATGSGVIPFVRALHDDLFTSDVLIIFRTTIYP
jgi:hypothetical protein